MGKPRFRPGLLRFEFLTNGWLLFDQPREGAKVSRFWLPSFEPSAAVTLTKSKINMKTKWFFALALAFLAFSCQKDDGIRPGVSDDSPAIKAGTSAWPDVFDPSHVYSFYFRMTEEDWNTVRFDATNEILKRAWFRAEGEEEILVELRRKSSRALPSEQDPWKIGMKVSINYVSGQLWHGINKLSLENGSDVGPVAEGVAWNLHEMASVAGFYGEGVHAGLAAWVKVFIKVCQPDDGEGFLLKDENPVNGDEYHFLGVYINVEQRNKRFLQNRGVYQKSNSYLYEVDDINVSVVEVGLNGDEGGPHSETYNALNFPPFQQSSGSGKKQTGTPTPKDPELKLLLDQKINMQAMLAQGAVDAFCTNPDALFSHGKNFKFIDFQSAYTLIGFNGDKRRLYLPWDLDAVFGRTDYPIYGQPGGRNKIAQSPYQSIILNHPDYRVQYNQVMVGLLDGPLNPVTVGLRLDEWKAAVDEALQSDPYETYGNHMNFDDLKGWIERRAPVVRQLVADNNAPAPRR